MLPQACAVGKGHELHAGAESKAKPPLQKHSCTDASAACQVSAPLPEEVKLQEGWEKPWGTVGGWHSGAEELQPEQSHTAPRPLLSEQGQ